MSNMNDDDLNINYDNDFENFNSPGGSTSGERGHEVHDDSLSEAETAEDRAFNKRMEKFMKPYFETALPKLICQIVAKEMRGAVKELQRTVPDLVQKAFDEELKKRNL